MEKSICNALGTYRVTYLCKPRCPVPLAIRLQVAAGICGFVYQAEQLNTLWKTKRQPPQVTLQLRDEPLKVKSPSDFI